jgi:hypothetical protein
VKYRKVVAQKVRTPLYDLVIQVNVPVRFYWSDDGFDGIDFGPIPKTTKYQLNLLGDIMEEMCKSLDLKVTKAKDKTPMPQYILKAFKKEDKEVKE